MSILFQRIALTISILCFWAGNVHANDSDVVNCNKAWKIVVIGSSTAFGIGASEPDSSWAGKFISYIKRRNQANEIINLAIPGYTTYQNLRPTGYIPPSGRPSPDPLFNITAALAENPDAIIINMPSNDAANNYTLTEQQDNFEAALALADANNIPVWVTTSQPRNNMTTLQIQNLEQLRDWVFLRFGDKAVDFWTVIANSDGSIADLYDFDNNVHVNNAGHQLFFTRMAAETILDSLCNRFTGTLVARAGNDQSIVLPLNQVTLDGSASSSGGTITSYSWAKVSGPSSFTLTSPNQPITLLGNLIEGRYAFELTVTDNNLITQKDTVNIIVSSRILIDIGPTNTVSPDAGGKFWNNFSDGLPGVKITNAVTVGNIATTIGLEIINRIDGTFNPAGPGTNTGNTAGIVGDYGNEATTDFAFAHPSATNGQWKITGLESNRQYTIKFWGTRTVPDDRVIEIKRADQATWQEYDAKNNTNSNTAASFTFFGQTEMTFDIRVKTGSAFGHICLIDISETAIPVNGNIPPIARAGADITLTLPNNSTNLNGAASTDDDGTIDAYEWTKIAGPVDFLLGSPNASITSLSNLTEGTYLFQLKVTDDQLATDVDTVKVTVNTRVLFDVGSILTNSPDLSGKYWNNVINGLPGVKVSNALTTANTLSGISLEIINRIDGTFNIAGPGINTGNTVGDVGDYPNSATTDNAFSHPSATNGQWKIAGLDNTKSYNVKFWGARSVADSRIIEIKRADETVYQRYDAANNTDFNRAAVFTLTGVTEMVFDIRTEVNSAFGYISVVDINVTIPAVLCIPVTPSVSITSDPAFPVCEGSRVSFVATAVNGGIVPSYQWFNGTNPINGETGSTYNSSTLVNGDQISVQLTSSEQCPTINNVNSNIITAIIAPNVPVSVNITANPGNTICAGSDISFTAIPVNGGTNPQYQWFNGSTPINGETNSTYTSNTLVNGDAISVQLTSSEVCAINNPATSNTVSMTVNTVLPVSVSITANPAAAICAGEPVTFSATSVNGGSNPAYQWFSGSNPIAGATDATFSSSSLVDGEQISVQLTSSEICTSGNPTVSNIVTTTVNPILPVSVSINANPAGEVCQGTSITFTATPTNGGSTGTYQWFNGITPISGETGPTFTSSSLSNGDLISVVLTSDGLPCISGNPATSNTVQVSLLSNVQPAVSIDVNPGATICSGTSVSFTAIPVNGGIAPQYQWFNGSTPINGETNSTYTSNTLVNGDAISVQLTSSEACAINNPSTSNTVNMTVNPLLPVSVSITLNPAVAVCAGTNIDFVANVINGGALPQFQWKLNGLDIPGAINPTFNSSSLQNGDQISCVVISNANCSIGNPATSNVLVSAINNPSTSLTSISICESSYTWNEITYTASGIYTFTTTNAAGCDSIATLNLTLTGSFVTSQITGPTNACSFMGDNGLIATYSVDAPAATSFVWNVSQSASIVSGQGTNTIGVRYLSSFGSGSVIVTIGNPCGSPVTRSVLVTRTIPAIPATIIGPLNVCTLVSINGQATYSVTPVANAITYRWTLPSTVTLLSATSDSTSITISFNAGFNSGSDKSIRVRSISGCGNSGIRTITLRADVPSAPTQINGQQNACLFLNTGVDATYFINKISDATSYEWNVPAGATIVGRPGFPGENDTVIIVNYNTSLLGGSQITVRGISTCGVGNATSLTLTRNAPGVPSIINGPTAVCAFTIPSNPAVYFIPKTPNASSYNWEVPAGAVITHPNGTGENDTLINVVFVAGLSSGNIRVAAVNGCGVSNIKSLTVRSSAPATPIITGPTDVCALIGVAPAVYKVKKVAGASDYIWGIPSVGATAVHPNPAGPEDTIIVVTYDSAFVSGAITVTAASNCRNSQTRSLNLVRGLPSTPGLISTTVISASCPVRRYSYAIPSLPANSTAILWTVPTGAVIDLGQGTVRIFVTYPSTAVSSQVTVVGRNGCGSSASSRKLNVSLPACPAPFARNITEQTKQQETLPLHQVEVSVMPNPSTNQFSLRMTSPNMGEWFSIRVTDINGKTIETRQRISAGQLVQIGKDYKKGIYFVTVIGDNYRNTYKLVKL